MMPAALEADPDNQALLLVSGQVALQANDLDECRRLWEKVMSMGDENLANKVGCVQWVLLS